MPGIVLTETEPQAPAGFYGKLPDKSDFVCRRLPRSFVEPWDAWLQRGIERSRQQLGPDWLSAYLRAPLWRFALKPGICGEDAMAGVMMASVDRVGRHFPLTLAASIPGDTGPAEVFSSSANWFAAAELHLLKALDQPFDLAEFDEQTVKLGNPHPDTEPRQQPVKSGGLLCVPLGRGEDFTTASAELLDAVLTVSHPSHSLWLTVGSESDTPSCLISQGLPSADDFAALLTFGTELQAAYTLVTEAGSEQ